jgi:hypothetical protein
LNGLIGAVGKQCRIHMLDNLDKALNLAIVATNSEKEEKASGRDDRGTSVRVFTLGGSRGGIPENRDKKHRGKIQWSGARGAGSQFRAGQTQNSRRVDGAYSYRTDHWTPAQPEDVLTPRGGSKSEPKADDDRYAPRRPHDLQYYNCRLVGHIPSNCLRGQKGNLNRIGRTKATPPSYPK